MSSKDEIVQEIRAAADRSVAARLEPLAAAVTALRTGLDAVAKQVDTLSAAVPKPGGVLPEAPLLALVEKLEGPAAAPTVASSGGADWATFKEAARAQTRSVTAQDRKIRSVEEVIASLERYERSEGPRAAG